MVNPKSVVDSYAEPPIEIGGVRLSAGQAMAVRVAITSYMEQMSEPDALGGDARGLRMAAAYRTRLQEVERIILDAMFQPPASPLPSND